jgi:hypothetical protein
MLTTCCAYDKLSHRIYCIANDLANTKQHISIHISIHTTSLLQKKLALLLRQHVEIFLFLAWVLLSIAALPTPVSSGRA